MEIHIEKQDTIYIIHLAGRWDVYSTAEFETTCTEYIRQGMRHVILNLAEVDYISSLGLRGLLNIGKELDPLKGKLLLCQLQPHIEKLFVGSGFSRLFATYPNLESAQQSLQKES